jgi:hypothetical protein
VSLHAFLLECCYLLYSKPQMPCSNTCCCSGICDDQLLQCPVLIAAVRSMVQYRTAVCQQLCSDTSKPWLLTPPNHHAKRLNHNLKVSTYMVDLTSKPQTQYEPMKPGTCDYFE